MFVGVFCGLGQVLMAAAVAPMAGVEDWAGGSNSQAGKQAGPVEVLGRADTAAGRWRGGKPPERPPVAGPLLQADAAAARRVSEGGAGFRCGQSCQRRQLRGRTGRPGDVSGPVAARGGWRARRQAQRQL